MQSSANFSDDRFQRMLQNAPVLIYEFDREGRFLYCSGGALALLKIDPAALIGRSILMMHEGILGAAEQIYQVLSGSPVHIITEVYDLTLEHWLTPTYDAAGEVSGGSGIAVDISERRRVEVDLRTAKDEADEANRAKTEFLSRVSHELRTPMNAILGFAQLLQSDEGLSLRQITRIDHILSAGQHLLELINEVLDVSRIESGMVAVHLEPVGLGALLREVLDIIEPMAASRAVLIDSGPPEAQGWTIVADRQRLAQVLLNLLSNGVKYNREGGALRVICSRPGEGWVRIMVSDTGIGIPAVAFGKLFAPFERLGRERSNVEGTGLGLALSRRLVELMGGSLGLASIEGQGSDFWVDLPEHRAPDPAMQSQASQGSAAAPEHQWKVLYIDPHIESTSLLEDILSSRMQIRLLRAMQGQLGFELARSQRPDLILLDPELPDLSGEELLHRLRELPETRDIPVVTLSAETDGAQARRFRELGARSCLPKPVNAAQLLAAIDALV
jgi:PAS domain S-box-containing protein